MTIKLMVGLLLSVYNLPVRFVTYFVKLYPHVLLNAVDNKEWQYRLIMYFYPLPRMPILGPTNSAANKDMMSKILTNWDTIF